MPIPKRLVGGCLRVATAIALAALRSGAPPVRAHSGRVDSLPTPGARLLRAPSEVRVQLDAPLTDGSFIQVIDDGFKRVDEAPTRLEGQPAMAMAVSVGALDPGGYTVQWTAVDALDGHVTRGSFSFEVLGPAAWLRAQIDRLNQPILADLLGRYWHILLGSWVLKVGLTAVAGRWYLRRRALRRAAQAEEALRELWEDEAS